MRKLIESWYMIFIFIFIKFVNMLFSNLGAGEILILSVPVIMVFVLFVALVRFLWRKGNK